MLNKRVVELYNIVMSEPVGPSHIEARRLTRKYVREMSPDAVQRIMMRRLEIEEQAAQEYLMRLQVFLEFGFMEAEAQFFARCRLNSPGIRTIIKERVQVTKHATPMEIKLINEGVRGTLKGLMMLYGEGGIYAKRKTVRT